MLTRRRSRRSQKGGVKMRPKAGKLLRGPRTIKKIHPIGRQNPLQKQGVYQFQPKLTRVSRTIGNVVGYLLPKKPRKLLDPLGAGPQCNKVIGIATPFTPCWLCGFKVDVAKQWPHPDSPICDHVLPIIMATVYFKVLKSLRGEIDDVLKLEYRWTHVLCNSLKSDLNLITMDESGKFIPYEEACKNLLAEIKRSGRNFDIPTRYRSLVSTTLGPICEILNKGGEQKLKELAGISSIFQLMEKKREEQMGVNVGAAAAGGTNDNSVANANANVNNNIKFNNLIMLADIARQQKKLSKWNEWNKVEQDIAQEKKQSALLSRTTRMLKKQQPLENEFMDNIAQKLAEQGAGASANDNNEDM